jgi:LasA protease
MKFANILRSKWIVKRGMVFIILITFLGSACQPAQKSGINFIDSTETPTAAPPETRYTPRPQYQPGQIVDYIAQTGDSLPALASHFNTTEKEIRRENPAIPNEATTLPPGFPMKIPIYYLPLWGNSFQIIPDSFFIDGPNQIGFSAKDFVNSQPGWFKNYSDNAAGELETGGDLVDHLARNFSISPRLLLALIEYQTGALTKTEMPKPEDDPYLLGYKNPMYQGLYAQLLWATNVLNNGYYGWRAGTLTIFEQKEKTLERPDPWQNAASVSLHYYFSQILSRGDYDKAISDQGFIKTYKSLFGDPWANVNNHIPGSLHQPPVQFPFEPGKVWAYTGGPHAGWGDGQPYAAIDFAPPSVQSGCAPSTEWVTAVADGIVTRSDNYRINLDLDGDGDEHTGWVLFYLHLSGVGMPPVGTRLKAGDRMGHPSCEGGEATGTHVHIARKYNGEWMLAGGSVPFRLEKWVVHSSGEAYQGTMTNNVGVVKACVCSDKGSQIFSSIPVPGP